QFFRELAKYSAMNFVQEWVVANLDLIAKGQQSDLSFEMYVRLNADNQVVVSDRFMKAFLISVSAKISNEIENIMFAVQVNEETAVRRFMENNRYTQASRALSDLSAQIGSLPMARMGINAYTIFEYGDNSTAVMKSTIQRSRK